VLADSISNAMNAAALFLVPGYGLLLFAVGTFIAGTFRAPTHDAHRPSGGV
jgi:hypothetical protein